MGTVADVYAELLSQYKYGHPLWYPEPSESYDGCVRHIKLGDVGFLDDIGGFRPLFNITMAANDPLNKDKVPANFIPIKYNPDLRVKKERAIDPGVLCSEGVKGRKVEAQIMGHV